jgi:hypothetical protein
MPQGCGIGGASCYRDRMTHAAPTVTLAVRIARNVTAELARHGQTPAADLPEITGLSDDTVRRRMKSGDWRIEELIVIADAVGLSGVDDLLK